MSPRDNPVAEAIEAIERGAEPRRPSRFGPLGDAARRGVLRLMRPWTAQQAAIDRTVARALADLDARISGTAAGAEPEYIAQDRRDMENLERLIVMTLAPDSNCIDVGAHRGDVLRQMVRAAPCGRHIAYEPLPHLHRLLVEEFPEVDVRCAALSNGPGTSTFVHVRNAEGWSGLKFRPLPGNQAADVEEITVELEALDDVLPPDYVPALIKIDVEGAERQVIEGALATLRRHQPIVVFEHGSGSAEHYGTGPDDVFRLLTAEAGLRIYDLDGRGPYSSQTFSRAFHAAERVNFVARA